MIYHTPSEASDLKVRLANDFATLNDEHTKLKLFKAARWNEMRKEYKSDTATDRAFDGTKEGLRLIEIEGRMKSINKLISAASSYLRNAENEARNNF